MMSIGYTQNRRVGSETATYIVLGGHFPSSLPLLSSMNRVMADTLLIPTTVVEPQ